MKYRVIVSAKAEKQLTEHILFIANVSLPAALAEKKRIVSALKSLEDFAPIHPFLDEEYLPKNKYHKLVVDKRYIILYQIKDSTVFADYILDTRQDYTWMIR